ncbi:MAG: NtaA/DmoA family FMN-dependent monooxygenase [Acidimicrobiales bacterium]|nr:NtaA/DmoA family FMN-dependent monooxygenase [Acidimicrobiales bacterium]
MTRMSRQMHLNAFVLYCAAPVTRLSWVYPEEKIRHQWWEMAYWEEIATTLERGSFDALFFADNIGGYGKDAASIRYGMHFPLLDPVVLVPRLAGATDNLGFVVTMSTSFTSPYQLARTMQTLDHVTEGRISWNIVTSANPHEGANVGTPLPEHDERYERAHEFMDVVYALWDSFEPDAMVMDHENRMLTDPDKVHRIDFEGRWHSSAGPLSVMPGPQGRPVLAQAGSSDAGRDFAAKHAEMVFAPVGTDEQRRDTIADIRTRASDAGRDPYDLKMVFTHGPMVAATTAEAEEMQAEVLARPGYESDVAALQSASGGLDLLSLDRDTRVSEILDQITGIRGPWENAAAADDPTIADFAKRFRNMAADSRFVGTPSDVADELEALMDATDSDGFQFSPTFYAPDYFAMIVDQLVPELQRRGRVRTGYAGDTLRENFLG